MNIQKKTLSPILVTDDGIVICVSDEHPANTPLLIKVKNDGVVNVTCASDEH